MLITIEAIDIHEVERIVTLLKSLNIKNIEVIPGPSGEGPFITKGNKKIDPQELFGIWKDQPRKVEEIRAASWKRNWNA